MIRSVLIVENDRKNARVVAIYLEQAGCRVVSAASRKDALAAASQELPLLVVLDLMLPDVGGDRTAHPGPEGIRRYPCDHGRLAVVGEGSDGGPCAARRRLRGQALQSARAGPAREGVLDVADNALKAIADHGAVMVQASARRGGEVTIAVEDDGVGIASADVRGPALIFEWCNRGSEGGLGIGRAMVTELAEARGGRTEVESEPGQGSVSALHSPSCRPHDSS